MRNRKKKFCDLYSLFHLIDLLCTYLSDSCLSEILTLHKKLPVLLYLWKHFRQQKRVDL